MPSQTQWCLWPGGFVMAKGCQIGRSVLPFHLFGTWVTSLVSWHPWCWITGVLTLASSVTLGKSFHLSEPSCPYLKK